VRGLIGVILIVLLGASCSAKEPAECEWRIQSDEAYNAAMTAIDSARAHSRHAADNYQSLTKSELYQDLSNTSEQLDVARGKVIESVGAAHLADDC
jgi:hypothetical protein